MRSETPYEVFIYPGWTLLGWFEYERYCWCLPPNQPIATGRRTLSHQSGRLQPALEPKKRLQRRVL